MVSPSILKEIMIKCEPKMNQFIIEVYTNKKTVDLADLRSQ